MHYLSGRLTATCLVITAFNISTIHAQTCFWTDGSPAEGYSPCNTTASATNCCAGGDACLTSGLCFMRYDGSTYTGACTDSSWKDPNCFQSCPKSYKSQGPNTLYRCSDEKWCCSKGGNITSCCSDPSVSTFNGTEVAGDIYNGSAWAPGFTLVQFADPKTGKTGGSFPTGSALPGKNGTHSAADSSCPAPKNDDATKVGLGVGLGVGVPLLAALGAVLFLWSKERRSNRDLRQGVGQGVGKVEGPGYGYAGSGNGGQKHWHEMPDEEPAKELPTSATAGRGELFGEGVQR